MLRGGQRTEKLTLFSHLVFYICVVPPRQQAHVPDWEKPYHRVPET